VIYFTSSWDDGSIYDLKLAELLQRYNQKATLYIPIENIENRAVVTADQIKDLSGQFEIGAHTVHHKYLITLSDQDAKTEITESKLMLEDIIQKEVFGFCFPGGKFKKVHLNLVKQAGFKYVRTVNMFNNFRGNYIVNTTLQAYDHSPYTYIRHLLKRGYLLELFQNFILIMRSGSWDKLLANILNNQIKRDEAQKLTVIHLWGHSWEIEESNSWHKLSQFFKVLNEYQIQSKTNFEIIQLKSPA